MLVNLCLGLWDVRAGGHTQQITPLSQSHKESVTDLKWISSKTGLEFYSCSTDGKVNIKLKVLYLH